MIEPKLCTTGGTLLRILPTLVFIRPLQLLKRQQLQPMRTIPSCHLPILSPLFQRWHATGSRWPSCTLRYVMTAHGRLSSSSSSLTHCASSELINSRAGCFLRPPSDGSSSRGGAGSSSDFHHGRTCPTSTRWRHTRSAVNVTNKIFLRDQKKLNEKLRYGIRFIYEQRIYLDKKLHETRRIFHM